MSHSKTFSKQFSVVTSSNETVTVEFTDQQSAFEASSNTLFYNSSEGVALEDGSIQSPALGFGHEIAHAARDLSDPEGYEADNHPSETTVEIDLTGETLPEISITWGTTPEDERVMPIESSMASELGEPQRDSHSEGEPTEVSSPTDSCVAGAVRPCP